MDRDHLVTSTQLAVQGGIMYSTCMSTHQYERGQGAKTPPQQGPHHDFRTAQGRVIIIVLSSTDGFHMLAAD